MAGSVKYLAIIYRYAWLLWVASAGLIFTIVSYRPDWYWALGIVWIAMTVLVGALFVPKAQSWLQWVLFMITPICLAVYGWWMFILVPANVHIWLALAVVVTGVFYWQGWRRLGSTAAGEEFFSTVSGSVSLVIYFFCTACLFSAILLLNLPLPWAVVILGVTTFGLVAFVFWLLEILWTEKIVYSAITTILMVQFFWVLSYLPISFYVSALILSIIYYMVTGLSRFRLVARMSRAVVLRYVGVSVVTIIVLLITSSWI